MPEINPASTAEYREHWRDTQVTHATPEPGTDVMGCCGLTVMAWRQLGNRALSTSAVRRNITCLGNPAAFDRVIDWHARAVSTIVPERAWRVDLSQPKPDQIVAGPLTDREREHQEALSWQDVTERVTAGVAAARKADATRRATAMARDGDQRCQDLMDILGVEWRG